MYRNFMASGEDEEVEAIISGKKWPTVIGTQSFIDWVKGKITTDPNFKHRVERLVERIVKSQKQT